MSKKLFHFKLQDKLIEIEFLDSQTTQDLLQIVIKFIEFNFFIGENEPLNSFACKFSWLQILVKLDNIRLHFIVEQKRMYCYPTIILKDALELKHLRNQDWFLGLYCNEKPSKDLSLSDFTFEKCIGKGGTSDVYLGF